MENQTFEEFDKITSFDEFKKWMNYEWNFSTHPKYRHYFETWFENITQDQIYYFKFMMWRTKFGIIGKTSIYFK